MFRTEISIQKAPFQIDHNTTILTIGSCFSDCIGEKFSENKFKVLPNPFGTVFNPISIFKALHMARENSEPSTSGYIEVNHLFQHFDFHSRFTSETRPKLEETLKDSVAEAHEFLKSVDVIIITMGTSLVYEHIELKEIVSNCHKVPQKAFRKYILTKEEVENGFDQLIKTYPASTQVILTVSPVRHVKDTLVTNSASKAVLRIACESIVQDHSNVHYFPSYEIMMDDLRDYRFYKSDMIHPSKTAKEYIWNKFTETYFSESTGNLLSEWSKIRSALSHRPFNPKSEAHQKFISETINKLMRFSDKFDITKELDQLKERQN